MKPAIRNGLTALIVLLLGANIAAVVVRHGRSDRTRVSVAPTPSTTVSPTTSTTTETTVTSTTVTSTTEAPATSTTGESPVLGAPSDAGATTTSTVPPATTVFPATTVPSTDPAAVQAAPAAPTEHPLTGGHPLSLLALVLVGLGLAGLRLARRARSVPSE